MEAWCGKKLDYEESGRIKALTMEAKRIQESYFTLGPWCTQEEEDLF